MSQTCESQNYVNGGELTPQAILYQEVLIDKRAYTLAEFAIKVVPAGLSDAVSVPSPHHPFID